MNREDLTQFETELSDLAAPIIHAKKTGYQWKAVDELLTKELAKHIDDPSTRCKKANGSGRAANVLTESNDKDIDLYLIFLISPYTAEQFLPAAHNRMIRFPNIKTVAVADEVNGVWRVRNLLVNSLTGLESAGTEMFPGVSEGNVLRIDTGAADENPHQIAEVPRFDQDAFDVDIAELPTPAAPARHLAEAFVAHCRNLGISLELTVAIDALACCLSTQQVVLAGPSGTGKSALAYCLRTFFAGPDRSVTIEASRGWTGPEDIVGYYSSITDTFAHTVNTAALIDLHESTLAGLTTGDMTPSFLTIEEANLSSIEGYLAPVVHAFGGSDSEMIAWHLHAQHDQVPDPEDQIAVPPILATGPYPRVLMTINVDPNSPAPARKVTSRGAVVLMEPVEQPNPTAIAEQLISRAESHSSRNSISELATEEGANFIGRPSHLRMQYAQEAGNIRDIVSDFFQYVSEMESIKILPSSREIEQVVNYVCAFELLCSTGEGVSESHRTIALENALMHFILPRLGPDEFGALVEELASKKKQHSTPSSLQSSPITGILQSRVERLAESARAQGYAGMVDFWSALS